MIFPKNPHLPLNMNNEVLIIMGRYPADKKTMTRLAEGIGRRETTDLYRSWVDRLLDRELTSLTNVQKLFLYADRRNKQRVEKWIGQRAVCVDPVSDDAEQNLASTLERVFAEGATKVVSVATDVPDLRGKDINYAFSALDRSEIVLGRDQSDGIYLFGLRTWRPEFFQRDPTLPPYRSAIEVIRQEKLSRYLMPSRRDIDTPRDYARWQTSRGNQGQS